MAKQTIDIGSSPNKGDGDPIRVAFDKINKNFTELYDGNFVDPANIDSSLIPQTTETLNLGSTDKKWADLHLSDFLYINGQRIEALPNGSLLVNGNNIVEDTIFGSDGTIADNIIPDTDAAYDLGSATNRFHELYLSGSTIDLGGTTISTAGGELRFGGVKVPTVTDLAAGITVNPTGDLQGSVFADDSTLLVDGVNGLITGRVTGPTYDPTNTVLLADPEDGDSYYNVISRDGSTTLVDAVNGNIPLQVVDKFVNRSLFSGDATVTSMSANLLQFDAYQGSQAFSEVTYQWSPANTGLYRLDVVLGLTESEVDLNITVFLYNVTANANQIQLFNGIFTGRVLSMSGTAYLTAGQNYQFGIIQTSGDDIILDKDLTSAGIEELTRV